MWQQLLDLILQTLLWIDAYVGNFGWAVIAFTVAVRGALLPITLPSLRAGKKMRELQPEIKELKKRFKDDAKGLQQAQMDLYKEKGVNPAAGCLPQIPQIVIFIAMYRVFIDLLNGDTAGLSSTNFLWLDITQPDPYYILPVVVAAAQLLLGLMVSGGADTAAEQTLAAQTEDTKDDDDANDATAMAQTMQQQMIFMMPVMTLIIALRFPSGLAVYWFTSTLISLTQQYAVSGWGNLGSYWVKFQQLIGAKS